MKFKVKLRVTDRSGKKQKYSFNLEEGRPFPIGREGRGLSFSDPSLHSKHCVLLIKRGELYVAAASKEIFLNFNNHPTQSNRITVGDLLELGSYVLEFLEVPLAADHDDSTRFIDVDDGGAARESARSDSAYVPLTKPRDDSNIYERAVAEPVVVKAPVAREIPKRPEKLASERVSERRAEPKAQPKPEVRKEVAKVAEKVRREAVREEPATHASHPAPVPAPTQFPIQFPTQTRKKPSRPEQSERQFVAQMPRRPAVAVLDAPSLVLKSKAAVVPKAQPAAKPAVKIPEPKETGLDELEKMKEAWPTSSVQPIEDVKPAAKAVPTPDAKAESAAASVAPIELEDTKPILRPQSAGKRRAPWIKKVFFGALAASLMFVIGHNFPFSFTQLGGVKEAHLPQDFDRNPVQPVVRRPAAQMPQEVAEPHEEQIVTPPPASVQNLFPNILPPPKKNPNRVKRAIKKIQAEAPSLPAPRKVKVRQAVAEPNLTPPPKRQAAVAKVPPQRKPAATVSKRKPPVLKASVPVSARNASQPEIKVATPPVEGQSAESEVDPESLAPPDVGLAPLKQ